MHWTVVSRARTADDSCSGPVSDSFSVFITHCWVDAFSFLLHKYFLQVVYKQTVYVAFFFNCLINVLCMIEQHFFIFYDAIVLHFRGKNITLELRLYLDCRLLDSSEINFVARFIRLLFILRKGESKRNRTVF